MSLHEDADHAHAHAPRARRDLLGLSALLGPDSQFVPISDFDGGEACGSPQISAGEREPTEGALALCGSCTTRCATVTQLLEHGARFTTTKDKP